jgi:hypothetical protein
MTSLVPLLAAWRANRGTTLRHAIAWGMTAWASWAMALASVLYGVPWDQNIARYLALSLTSCAGIAVLGARRPGVGAWNFVVVGLLAVLLLPVGQGWGEMRLHPLQLVFLGGALVVGIGNYLLTRLGLAALLLACACAMEVARLAGLAIPAWAETVGKISLALGPWVGWLCAEIRRNQATEFDTAWLAFRDRFGLFWALRTMAQFNRAADHGGWGVELEWPGLGRKKQQALADSAVLLQGLNALLKRFTTNP